MIKLKVRDIEVKNKIGESQSFRVYHGEDENGQGVVIKVAANYDDNDKLAAEAGLVVSMQSFADKITGFETELNGGKKLSRYDLLFAKLETTFIEQSQGDRRINVFSVPETSIDKLTPLVKLSHETQIDARSSVWILGRLLKFYSMFELMTIDLDNKVPSYPSFSPSNFFIGPERHRLICYNFPNVEVDAIATDHIKAIASFILDWVVIEKDESEEQYLRFLKDLSANGRKKFKDAHMELYANVSGWWGFEYHPFTYRDRNTSIWKTIKED